MGSFFNQYLIRCCYDFLCVYLMPLGMPFSSFLFNLGVILETRWRLFCYFLEVSGIHENRYPSQAKTYFLRFERVRFHTFSSTFPGLDIQTSFVIVFYLFVVSQGLHLAPKVTSKSVFFSYLLTFNFKTSKMWSVWGGPWNLGSARGGIVKVRGEHGG